MKKKFLVTGGNGFIGTNLIDYMRKEISSYSVHIVDIQAPRLSLRDHEKWIRLDIMDKLGLEEAFLAIKPDVVIHLAAETKCDPHMTLTDYTVNTTGSQNVFDAAEKAAAGFLINTSTQFVHQWNGPPKSNEDFAPFLPYGESKAIAEKRLANGNYSFNWVIIRPTNIWGPYHKRYPDDVWKVMRDGKYLHPGRQRVIRSFGYVGNVAQQIVAIQEKTNDPRVSRKVLYVGDEPIALFEWADAFSLAITGRGARAVPAPIVFLIAMVGSLLQIFRIGFPITLSRFRSMTEQNPAPMQATFDVTGPPRFPLAEAIRITTQWLRDYWQGQAR